MTLEELARQWREAGAVTKNKKEKKLCDEVAEYLEHYYDEAHINP